MTGSNKVDRPTDVLRDTGEILRTLSPSRLGLLFVISNTDANTQTDIADAIGRSQSTISQYCQRLTTIEYPLIAKRGKRYVITDTGKEVLSLVDDMTDQLNLQSVEWCSKTDKKAIETILSPLHESQIAEPFFILESLYNRSYTGGHSRDPQSVWIDDIIDDVKSRQRDAKDTTKQVQQIVKRFDNASAVTFDGSQLMFTEKGEKNAQLLIELTHFLMKREGIDTDSDKHTESRISTPSTESPVNGSADRSGLDDLSSQTHDVDSIAQQRQPQRFLGSRRSSIVNQSSIQGSPTVVLTYCLRRTSEADRSEESHSQPIPVLLLTALTASELAARAEQIIREHGEDTQLIPYWTLQTSNGLSPLGPAGIPPTDIPEFDENNHNE